MPNERAPDFPCPQRGDATHIYEAVLLASASRPGPSSRLLRMSDEKRISDGGDAQSAGSVRGPPELSRGLTAD